MIHDLDFFTKNIVQIFLNKIKSKLFEKYFNKILFPNF